MARVHSVLLPLLLVYWSLAPVRVVAGADARGRAEPVDTFDQLIAQAARASADKGLTKARLAEQIGIELGDWYCCGPFRDEEFGILRDSFRCAFEPEKDVLRAGRKPANLKKVYDARRFPGMLAAERRWSAQPQWIDGYRHGLPRGPAPSRCESVYLYRTITVARPASLAMTIFAEDCIAVWLNGERIAEALDAELTSPERYSRYSTSLEGQLDLSAGANRVLVKVTSKFGAHGFAFSLPQIMPGHPVRPGETGPTFLGRGTSNTNFTPLDGPLFSEQPESREYPVPQTTEACVRRVAELLNLSEGTVAEATGEGSESLRQLQDLSRRVARYADAAARLERFRFDVAPTPMYDPPTLSIEPQRDRLYGATSGGRTYLERLKSVREEVEPALRSRTEKAVLSAERALEGFWQEQVGQLPPIAFLRCPVAFENAVCPWDSPGRTPPASICVYDPSRPEKGARVIFGQDDVMIYDMNVSWDGKTIFFSARFPHHAEHFRIYEVGVGGEHPKQITRGPGDDISPCELPSGQLAFVSTRADTMVICQPRESGVLYVCDRDGGRVRKVSANIDSDHTPQVTDDGRLLFTRWDYGIEKNVFTRQALWTQNPDGTSLRLFFGNTIERPNGFWKARPIPGRPEVVCVLGPHHQWQSGMIGLAWNGAGTEALRGIGFRYVTTEAPQQGDHPRPMAYRDPFPLNERLFLVSYGGDGAQKLRLYLLDDRGNRKCIYEAKDNLSCLYPLPLNARERPPVIPARAHNVEFAAADPAVGPDDRDTRDWATMVLQDVYRGISTHVKRGEAKHLQIMEQLFRPKYECDDPVGVHGIQVVIGRGTSHVRRLIGNVPIEDDGSAHFKVPPLRNISFNLLDAEGKLLMRMGSDIHVMPGEVTGCVGCHEVRESTDPPVIQKSAPKAVQRAPSVPTRPNWATHGLLDYQKVIQPVWDRYCVECHSGPKADGMIDLSSDRTRLFCMSYDHLVERGLVSWHSIAANDSDENTPKSLGSRVSRLCRYIDTPEHCQQSIPPELRRRVYTWIDANVPYYATYRFTRPGTNGGRDAWTLDQRFYETFDRRCMSCHRRRAYNQSWRGGPMTVSSKLWANQALSTNAFQFTSPKAALYGPHFRVNLTRPAHSLLLVAPLSESAGGLGLCRQSDGRAVFKDSKDPDYQFMLRQIETARRNLSNHPRMDMQDTG